MFKKRSSLTKERKKAGLFTIIIFSIIFSVPIYYIDIIKLFKVNNNVDLIYMLDNSGSMREGFGDIVDGYNDFLLRNKHKKIKISLVLFGNQPFYVYKNKSIKNVPNLTLEKYTANSDGTDSLCQVLDRVSKILKGKNNLIVIHTDQYQECYLKAKDLDNRTIPAALLSVNGVGRINKKNAFFFEFSEPGIADSFYTVDDIITNYIKSKNR